MESPPDNSVNLGLLNTIKSEKIAITPYEVDDGLFRPFKAKPKVAADMSSIAPLGQIPNKGNIPSAGPALEGAIMRDINSGEPFKDPLDRTDRRQRRLQMSTGLDKPFTPMVAKPKMPTEKNKLNSVSLETMRPSDMVTWMDNVTNNEWRLYNEPETILRDAQIANGGASLSSTAHNKLLACMAVIHTDAFFDYWHLFEKMCVAFNNTTPNFAFMDELSPGEIGFAISEVDKIRESHPDYAMEVKLYIACKCQEDGLIVLPSPLSHFQEVLDKMSFRRETKEEYINLKLDIEDALQAGQIDISKTDAVSVGVAKFMATKWICENGPQAWETAEEKLEKWEPYLASGGRNENDTR